MGKNAFVTLATNDDYAIGALVLAESIHNAGTNADIVILITTGVSEGLRETLTSVFTKVIQITELNSENKEILDLINRPELSVTISKINAWQLTDYEKCVFIDADCLVIKSIDELFDKPELSAVCDLGWPDCFNSGVFVFKPSLDTYNGLLNLLKAEDSFDGGDQGLLNVYFSDWIDSDINKRLSFIYNMHSSAAYTYLPAFRKFGERVKIIHFLGAIKPWMYNYNKSTNEITSTYCATHNISHVQSWWNIFIEKIKDKLPKNLTNICLPEGLCDYFDLVVESKIEEEYVDIEEDNNIQIITEEEVKNIEENKGIAGQLSELEITKQDDDFYRKKQWEAGNIDYLGKDSFDNIQKKLQESIGKQ